MTTTLEYLEQVDRSGTSPHQGGFSIDGGRFIRPYRIEAPTTNDLIAGIVEILGTTQYEESGDGTLVRTPPLADPQYPWMYASSITAIVGNGGQFVVTDSSESLEIPPISQYALYPWYVIIIEFKPRPYAVALDSDVQQYSGTYYPVLDNGTSSFSFVNGSTTATLASPQSYTYVDEWIRYTDFDTTPQNDYVTAQVGGGHFLTNHSLTPDAANAQPMISPRIFMPNDLLILYWFQVPLRLVTSPYSYIKRWRGRVNQNSLNWPGGPYTPGSLLYLDYLQKKYAPPVPNQILNPFGNAIVFSQEKLCDITMRFLRTNRYVPDPPSTPIASMPNRNFVIGGTDSATMVFNGGHNALPWFTDRNFHTSAGVYVAGASTTSYMPWLSAPLELLFTDCDSNQTQSGSVLTGGVGP